MDVNAFTPDLELEGPFAARLVRTDDLDALVALEATSQAAPWTERVFARELELDFSRTWVVDWTDDHAPSPIAAYLVFWLVHDEVHVLNVVVHPDARRRGLARTLLEKLISISEQQGASMLSLELRVSNVPARKLYESLGFVEIGSRANYYADNQEDAEVMALLLSG